MYHLFAERLHTSGDGVCVCVQNTFNTGHRCSRTAGARSRWSLCYPSYLRQETYSGFRWRHLCSPVLSSIDCPRSAVTVFVNQRQWGEGVGGASSTCRDAWFSACVSGCCPAVTNTSALTLPKPVRVSGVPSALLTGAGAGSKRTLAISSIVTLSVSVAGVIFASGAVVLAVAAPGAGLACALASAALAPAAVAAAVAVVALVLA